MIRIFAKLAVILILCIQLAACQAAAANEQISVETLAVQIAQGTRQLCGYN